MQHSHIPYKNAGPRFQPRYGQIRSTISIVSRHQPQKRQAYSVACAQKPHKLQQQRVAAAAAAAAAAASPSIISKTSTNISITGQQQIDISILNNIQEASQNITQIGDNSTSILDPLVVLHPQSSSSSSSAVNCSSGGLPVVVIPVKSCKMAAAAAAAPAGGVLVNSATVVHSILGTSLPLEQITKVRMVMDQKCKMGISFWPMFTFKPPERDEKSGTAKVVNRSEVPAEMTAAGSSSSGGSGGEVPSVSSQLLHVNFTQDPPDEFSVGAKFLGGIPFPFITIRTTRLEGTIDPLTGAVVLLFQAKFLAGFGSKNPTELTVNANLTSEPAQAFKQKMEGSRLANGHVTLVSAAEVPKTSSWFANFILWLPTAATAKLPMKLDFS